MAKLLGIVLPSNNPEQFFSHLAPTLEHIKEIADQSVFLINFQPPWTVSERAAVARHIERIGFECRHIFTKWWTKPIKIIKMREQCALLAPECKYYLFIDDDFKLSPGTKKFKFTSGQRYLQSLDYLERWPRCGLINTKSFLGGHKWGLKIGPTKHDMYATNRGLFLRSMKKHGFLLSPEGMHDLRGDLEESALAFARIELGYFPAKQMNNPTIHLTGKLDQYDDDPLNMHNYKVINENVGKWIRERYDDPDWEYEQKRLPGDLFTKYLAAGGIDITEKKYTIAY